MALGCGDVVGFLSDICHFVRRFFLELLKFSPPLVLFFVTQSPGITASTKLVSQLVMTPIIFISFVVSLALIDLRHSASRAHYHAEQEDSRLPRWLHRLIYRYQPYQYVPVDERGNPLVGKTGGHQYYHSKQRKLMKMEVDDAFEIRNRVLVVLGLLSLCILWGAWRLLSWLLQSLGLIRQTP